ncbi:MAG: SDR family oxidoreductase [Chlamydiota bacterium]|jgi:UDP-glucose 4-epimerase
MKNVLITGGAGFIGSHLSEKLIHEGHKVTVIDNLKGGWLKNLQNIIDHPNFTFVKGDIRNTEEISLHFNNIDWVFHLAALADIVPSIEQPKEYFETNVIGTFNVLELAKKANVARFIYAASSSCYGIPDTYPTPESHSASPQYPYALTKYLGEELVMHWGKIYQLPVVSLRLFNVYGPRARTTGAYGAVFGVFLAQKLNGKPLTVVGNGQQTRDFTYVTDVADAFFEAAKSDVRDEIMNVGSGGHYSVNDIVKIFDCGVTYIPKRPGEPDCTFADITKISQKLNWKAKVTFEEGVYKLLDTIDDFKDAPVWEPESIKEATKTWFTCLK